MIEQVVSAKSLSCMLNADKLAERLPEPFRLQSSVSFRITYSEYYNYMLSPDADTITHLNVTCTYLRSLAMSQNPKLYRYFLADCAFAICKELHFAEAYDMDATVILPASFSGTNVPMSTCLEFYDTANCVEDELFALVNNTGYYINSIKRAHNIKLWKLAVYLFYLSKVYSLGKEVNLVYS
jgi:hypothetical protein